MYILFYLLVSIAVLATVGCSHNNTANRTEDTENSQPVIVSIRNPDIVIKKPVTFSWLPESNKLYEDPRLIKFAVRELIQSVIKESLTKYDYEYSQVPNIFGLDHIKSGTPVQPKDLVLIKNWEWAGPNFGAGGFLKEVNLENRSSQNYRDIKIKIDYLGTKGPKEGFGGPTSIFVIHDLLPANSERTFKDINVGFRHPDSRTENLRVLDVKAITSDLFIGYTLTIKRSLTDYDINRRFRIYPGLPEELYKINKYEKGTLIVDIIDSNTRVIIWRGALQTFVDFYTPEDIRLRRIRLAVDSLINNFILSNQKT